MEMATASLVHHHAQNALQQPPPVQGVRPTTRYHQTFVAAPQDSSLMEVPTVSLVLHHAQNAPVQPPLVLDVRLTTHSQEMFVAAPQAS